MTLAVALAVESALVLATESAVASALESAALAPARGGARHRSSSMPAWQGVHGGTAATCNCAPCSTNHKAARRR